MALDSRDIESVFTLFHGGAACGSLGCWRGAAGNPRFGPVRNVDAAGFIPRTTYGVGWSRLFTRRRAAYRAL